MKKLLLLAIIAFGNSVLLNAQDYRGGEIAWTCLKSGPDLGKYKFSLVLYYDCSSGLLAPATEIIKVENGSFPNITVNRLNTIDINSSCYDTSMALSCQNLSAAAVSKVTYESAPVTLNGTPPPGGWAFTWTDCCRPTTTNLTNGQGFTLSAIMYPYQGKNANPCFDSSPAFLSDPVASVTTDYGAPFNHLGIDEEFDELVFEFADPLTNYTTWPANPVSFASGYSSTNPFPDNTISPNNVAATIDNQTGEVNFTSFDNGFFAHAVKAKAFRNGTKIAEVVREVVLEIRSGNPLPPPFTTIFNVPPSVTFVRNGITQPGINLIAFPGELIEFQIMLNDAGVLPGFLPQQVAIRAEGQQFGAGLDDTTAGCAVAPCATLDTKNSSYDSLTMAWLGINQVSTDFRWRVDAGHASDSGTTHLFYFRNEDDYCPIPGKTFATASITVYSVPSFIKGTIFDDLDSNGVQDPGEGGVPHVLLKVQPGNRIFSTDTAGNYCINLPYGTYTVEPVLPKHTVQTFPLSPANYNVTLSALNGTSSGNNFGLHKLQNVHDLQVGMSFAGPFYRPGNQIWNWITYENDGTITLNGDVTLTLDSILDFVSSVPPPSSQSGDTITWNFANLMPAQSATISFLTDVPLTATLGDSVLNSVVINPVSGETFPQDNYDTIHTIIANSFDPNIKTVSPPGPVTPWAVQNGQELRYTIHFQNTGNAPAIDIMIEDTIEAGLDLASFRMISSSHSNDYQILGNYIRWIFKDINLPDSVNNEPESHGYIKFSMMMDDGLQLGDSVENEAFIYFDNNEAIITPLAITRIQEPDTSIGWFDNVALGGIFDLYPNPSTNEVTMAYELPSMPKHRSELCIYNLQGQLKRSYLLGQQQSGTLRISKGNLAEGTYLVVLIADGQHNATKLLIFLE